MIKSGITKTLNFAGFIMLITIVNFKELTLQSFSLYIIVIPRLDRGIQETLGGPVEPDDNNICIACNLNDELLSK